MNNKLIADIEIHRQRGNILRKVVPELEGLVKNSDTFTKEESIEVLNKIREKLVLLSDELKNSYVIAKKMRMELRDCCTHEVLIKKSNYYECVICGNCFGLEHIDFNSFLVESLENCPYLYVMVSDIIGEIAIKGEDIFAVFEDMLYKKYKTYDDSDNLLVYRRSR